MIAAEQDLTDISFHEAGLTGIVYVGDVATLILEDIQYSRILKEAEVNITGIKTVLRNGLLSAGLRMEAEEGEILTLGKENSRIPLAIQWDNFVAKSHEVIAYTLDGPTITLRLTPAA